MLRQLWRSWLRCAVVVALWAVLGAANQAAAFHVFKVDPYCPDASVFSTIKGAVDAAAAYDDADHADYVWIATNSGLGYSGQHILINDPNAVIIEGGFFDCTDFDPGTDQTTVSGAGNDGGPVFEITGNSHVYLGNLVITGAQHTALKGGGVSFIGQGDLTLGNTTVSNNHAGVGGGIYMEYSNRGTSADLSLTLLANTQIAYNGAGDGGGIALVGSVPGFVQDLTVLHADAPDTWIAYNSASGLGGGLLVEWLAEANIGSPGLGDLGVLYNNSAASGGAVAVSNVAYTTSYLGSTLKLYTSDPAHPVRIRNNTATQFGGAVYLEAYGHDYEQNIARLDAQAFRMDENIAAEGAAIYAVPGGGQTYVRFNPYTYPASQCAAGAVCNSIDHNVAADSDGLTGGATITSQENGFLQLDRVSLRNNTGGNVVHVIGTGFGAGVRISNSVIADNTTSSDLLKFAGPAYYAPIDVVNVTISHNAITSPNVIYAEHNINVDASIFDQPGSTCVGYAGPVNGLIVSDSIASDAGASNQGFVQGTPTFVNAAASDYHLVPWSTGVDFANEPPVSEIEYEHYDLDGNPRLTNLSSIPNFHPGQFAYRDAGAYELQFVCAPDEVFCSGFDH